MVKLFYLNLWPLCLRVAQSSRSGFLVSSYHDQMIVFEYMTVVLTHSWVRRIRPFFSSMRTMLYNFELLSAIKKTTNMYTEMCWRSHLRTHSILFSSWPHICEHHCIFLSSSRALGSWGNFPNPSTSFVFLPQAFCKSCACVHFRWRHLPRLPALICRCPSIQLIVWACNCGCQRVLIQC